MSVFSSASFCDHEQVVFAADPASGLRAIIAIHSTRLGPSLGGCRMWPYKTDDQALEDVLRLSRAMTFKAAVAGTGQGGGKAVIIGDPARDKSDALFEAMGRFVESLGGRYMIAEDSGTTLQDIEIVARQTRFAGGLTAKSGDPSPATAWGTFHGVRAAVEKHLKHTTLEGVTVAVQGLGNVGMQLCRFLHEAGARLIVSDIKTELTEEAAARFGAALATPGEILFAEADVIAPCALGAVLDDVTIPRLKATVVAGAANNQLAEDRHGQMLLDRGILYAPDYVINAGGIIDIDEVRADGGYDESHALDRCAAIYGTLMDLFRRAEADGATTNLTADRMAQEILARGIVTPLAKAS